MTTRKIVYTLTAILVLGTGVVYAGLAMEQGSSSSEDFVRDSYHIYTVEPGVETHGSKYTIPLPLAEGTNLSRDSYISYEVSDAQTCGPKDFLYGVMEVEEVIDDGITYLVGHTVGAGAGNRYDETVYVFKDYKPCSAVRYFIHYGVIGNYPEGSVREFDRAALISEFDAFRRGLARSR